MSFIHSIHSRIVNASSKIHVSTSQISICKTIRDAAYLPNFSTFSDVLPNSSERVVFSPGSAEAKLTRKLLFPVRAMLTSHTFPHMQGKQGSNYPENADTVSYKSCPWCIIVVLHLNFTSLYYSLQSWLILFSSVQCNVGVSFWLSTLQVNVVDPVLSSSNTLVRKHLWLFNLIWDRNLPFLFQ